ncbi:MAG: 50S ribosomal protein L25/general stress protein Ctc [Salibacteraceae bacterium]
MKTIEINGHLREAVGSQDAKQLRKEGHVPCVVYGGSENLHFHADERELNKIIFTPDVYLVNLKLDDKKVQAVTRDAQFHPVKDNLLHMDFVEVVPGQPISLKLPVSLEGNAIGVKNGGVLRRNAKMLYVKGSVDDLPDTINIDISQLRIGQTIKVGELTIPGVTMLEADNRVVVAIKTSRKAISDEEAEAALESAAGEEGAAEGEEGAAEGAEKGEETPAEG